MDPNILLEFDISELGNNLKNLNLTTWFPYSLDDSIYKQFETKMLKNQNIMCKDDPQKCPNPSLFNKAPKVKVKNIFYNFSNIALNCSNARIWPMSIADVFLSIMVCVEQNYYNP